MNSAAGRPLSQYGLLWEACVHSFPYLSHQLAEISSIVELPTAHPNWIPFSIPLIIKQLVGNALKWVYICIQEYLLTIIRLEDICIALDYNIHTV
jgi:hypothetical protein